MPTHYIPAWIVIDAPTRAEAFRMLCECWPSEDDESPIAEGITVGYLSAEKMESDGEDEAPKAPNTRAPRPLGPITYRDSWLIDYVRAWGHEPAKSYTDFMTQSS